MTFQGRYLPLIYFRVFYTANHDIIILQKVKFRSSKLQYANVQEPAEPATHLNRNTDISFKVKTIYSNSLFDFLA